mmetsp:Transcript_59625/g.122267  ORF Transcript_59625/g.122267 Transcript_59625/m.122267 type:complete len:248 (-) Transcript_59625:530-1273(-)
MLRLSAAVCVLAEHHSGGLPPVDVVLVVHEELFAGRTDRGSGTRAEDRVQLLEETPFHVKHFVVLIRGRHKVNVEASLQVLENVEGEDVEHVHQLRLLVWPWVMRLRGVPIFGHSHRFLHYLRKFDGIHDVVFSAADVGGLVHIEPHLNASRHVRALSVFSRLVSLLARALVLGDLNVLVQGHRRSEGAAHTQWTCQRSFHLLLSEHRQRGMTPLCQNLCQVLAWFFLLQWCSGRSQASSPSQLFRQ